MRVILRRCLIRNWGERFDVRSFAAWAHHGGRIEAYACVFDQSRFWRGWRLMARDWLAHLGQAWNDEGPRMSREDAAALVKRLEAMRRERGDMALRKGD